MMERLNFLFELYIVIILLAIVLIVSKPRE